MPSASMRRRFMQTAEHVGSPRPANRSTMKTIERGRTVAIWPRVAPVGTPCPYRDMRLAFDASQRLMSRPICRRAMLRSGDGRPGSGDSIFSAPPLGIGQRPSAMGRSRPRAYRRQAAPDRHGGGRRRQDDRDGRIVAAATSFAAKRRRIGKTLATRGDGMQVAEQPRAGIGTGHRPMASRASARSGGHRWLEPDIDVTNDVIPQVSSPSLLSGSAASIVVPYGVDLSL
jgi:hypothetical protein